MSSRGDGDGGGGGGGLAEGSRVSISDNAKQTIQNIREITGKQHRDEEIYVTLKECSMDPNETAEKLLYMEAGGGRNAFTRRENGLNRNADKVKLIIICDDDDDDDEDDEEALLAELERIKKEKAEEKLRQEKLEQEEQLKVKEAELLRGNPLINSQTSFSVKRRWDDDVVFKKPGPWRKQASKALH